MFSTPTKPSSFLIYTSFLEIPFISKRKEKPAKKYRFFTPIPSLLICSLFWRFSRCTSQVTFYDIITPHQRILLQEQNLKFDRNRSHDTLIRTAFKPCLSTKTVITEIHHPLIVSRKKSNQFQS